MSTVKQSRGDRALLQSPMTQSRSHTDMHEALAQWSLSSRLSPPYLEEAAPDSTYALHSENRVSRCQLRSKG